MGRSLAQNVWIVARVAPGEAPYAVSAYESEANARLHIETRSDLAPGVVEAMHCEPMPKPPRGFRIITDAEKDAISGLSGYLRVYPKILHCVRRYDLGYRKWMPEGPYRFLWQDSIYATKVD